MSNDASHRASPRTALPQSTASDSAPSAPSETPSAKTNLGSGSPTSARMPPDRAQSAWITPSTPPPLPGSIGTQSAPPSAPQPLPMLSPSTGPYGSRPKRTGQRRAGSEDRQPTPEALRIRSWTDELIEKNGYPAAGFYVERYWGPIIGPTTLMLFRALARKLESEPDGFNVLTNNLATTVGCSARSGSASQFWRAVRRASRFGLLRQQDDRIIVRPAVGLLTSRMAQRLPQELRQEHRMWIDGAEPSGVPLLDSTAAVPGVVRISGPAESGLLSESNAPFALEFLRTAARGLCTPEELRLLDNQRRLV